MPPGAPEPRRIGTIWTLDPDQPLPAIQPLVEAGLTRLGLEATGALARASGNSEVEIRRRFDSGRLCYAARVDGRLAAYGWVSFSEEYVGELDLRLTLLPCEAYIWDCATLPEFRQKRLYSALLVYIAGELRADGRCRVWIGADLDNQPSQKGIDRAGFLRVADLGATITAGLGPGKFQFQVLPYPGVPPELAAEAGRLFLSHQASA